jgi:UDP-N-acetylmuramyl pentapeptide phosphotransferase/UDP-N-acetylglucosamine-1-phosphate transferase
VAVPPSVLATVGILAAVGSWLLTLGVIRVAHRIGLLDRPNERSSHERATPRGGGIAIVVVVTLVVVGLSAVTSFRANLLAVATAALLVGGVSLRDDFRSLAPGVRFACHVAAASFIIWTLGSFQTALVPGFGSVRLGGAGIVLTLVWIVGLTNAYNFMDGIDGIAGAQGLVAGLAWAIAGSMWGVGSVALIGVTLAGACSGFLVPNWRPASVFLGDVGSAFLGFYFAVLPLLAAGVADGRPVEENLLPPFALLVVWPFVVDAALTFARRVWGREAAWKPHRTHLYQRLVQAGWRHDAVASLYALWAVGCAAIGLWLATWGSPGLLPTLSVSIGILMLIQLLVMNGECKTFISGGVAPPEH